MIELLAAAGLLYLVYKASQKPADGPQPEAPPTQGHSQNGQLFGPGVKKVPGLMQHMTMLPTGERVAVTRSNVANDPNVPSLHGDDSLVRRAGSRISAAHTPLTRGVPHMATPIQ